MKKTITYLVLLLMMIAFPIQALATTASDELAEKDKVIAELTARIAELEAQLNALRATPKPTPKVTPTPKPTRKPYELLKKGSKGDGVVSVQSRLKQLGYLSGYADGAYGSGTASAVKEFQKVAGLRETGEADNDTQVFLFSAAAPPSPNPVVDDTQYEKLDYKANSRDPEAYEGTKIKFSGRIIQVMEDGDYAIFRIASRGKYDDVVYCHYEIPKKYKRFLEEDNVMVYGTSMGIYTYETILGGSITIPYCAIDRIELK